MKIKEITDFLSQNAHWMNLNETRDLMLCGNAEDETARVGVCWVVTNQVIDQAIEKQI